jgi:hypothetical protein
MLALAATGCGTGSNSASGTESNSQKSLLYVALDTSNSVGSEKGPLFRQASTAMIESAESVYITLYRFDAEPAECWTGANVESEEDAAGILTKAYQYKSTTIGTNLRKLLDSISARLKEQPLPAEVLIFTDCGFEEMQNDDLDACKLITKQWAERSPQVTVKLIGVKDGYREKLRALFQMPPAQLEFL